MMKKDSETRSTSHTKSSQDTVSTPQPSRTAGSNAWQCAIPSSEEERVSMTHGGGGKLSQRLVDEIFLPVMDNPFLHRKLDAALLDCPGGKIAMTTDSYVVTPRFFPGGNIAKLSVYGTINDLAVSGATPLAISAAWILEEGFAISELKQLAEEMGAAAREVGVPVVAGDTKVVDRGRGDGCYITTTGIGIVPYGSDIGPHRICAGDAILISGTIGDHGMSIMAARGGLPISTEMVSDCAPLHELIASLISAGISIHAMRDPTRGGLSSALNELANGVRLGFMIEEGSVPIAPLVRSACEMLGIDPWTVANEGKLLLFVPLGEAEHALRVLQNHPLGQSASIVGRVVEDHPGIVVGKTQFGTHRIVVMPSGDSLPRIC